MLTKRKATKKSLDELREIMPVLSEGQQRGHVGGRDCWWRSVAYIKSAGSNYSAATAFDLENRFGHYLPLSNNDGTAGYPSCFQNFATNHITGGLFGMPLQPTGTIITFNPNNVSSSLGGVSGISHSVVFRDIDVGSGRMIFYCPQNQTTGYLCLTDFNNPSNSGNFRTHIR